MSKAPIKTVGVVVLGNWGTALGQHLANKGFEVLGWSADTEIVGSINSAHHNLRFLTNTKLSSRFKATNELKELADCEMLVLACPSSALEDVVGKIPIRSSSVWISAIKGFVGQGVDTPLQYLRRYLLDKGQLDQPQLAVLSGPSFAKDVIVQHPVGVVAASYVEATALYVAEQFGSESMRVYVSTDTLGVELGGILKNIIALAAGVSDGLGLGESAKAGLVTRGLAEMVRLSTAMGADANTLFGLSGLGDLSMSATCDASRNRTVGLRLGKGEKLQDIISTLGSTAEGVRSTPLVLRVAKQYKVYMPICEAAGQLLEGKVTARQVLLEMMTRPPKREW